MGRCDFEVSFTLVAGVILSCLSRLPTSYLTYYFL